MKSDREREIEFWREHIPELLDVVTESAKLQVRIRRLERALDRLWRVREKPADVARRVGAGKN